MDRFRQRSSNTESIGVAVWETDGVSYLRAFYAKTINAYKTKLT